VYQFIERIINDRDQLIVRADEKPEAESVSSFAMRNLPLMIGEGGGFQAAVEQPDELRYQLTETFATAARIGRDEVYEADNLIAWLRPPIMTARGNHLVVDATRALGRDRIPPFLLDRARLGFRARGIFLPEEQRAGPLVPTIPQTPI
jgi:hypothetical protein